MRNVFIEELIQAAQDDPRVVLVVGDLGFSVIEPFVTRFPGRFYNAGVAEQNMMGLSAGLASEGFHVFAYSIANFPTYRCAEQIRNDIAYQNLPVTVVTVGGGLSYGNLGYSHHAVQDYGLMRGMPGMLIAAPGDPWEVRACMRYLLAHPQPSYLRLGKAGEPAIHTGLPDVAPGRWVPVRTGNTHCVLSTGAPLRQAHSWVTGEGPHAGGTLMSMPLWGMNAKAQQPAQVAPWEQVTTVEDHLADCGFGSWMAESLMGQGSLAARLQVRALDPKVCGMVGSQAALNAAGGL